MDTLLIESKTGPPAEPPVVRDYLSYSAIRSYVQCPLRYKFRYVDQLPEERTTVNLVFGNAIHGALELHFRRLLEGSAPPTLAELLQAYHAGWEQPTATRRFGNEDQPSLFDGLAAIRGYLSQQEWRRQ